MKSPMSINGSGVEAKKTEIIKSISETNFVLGSSRWINESIGIYCPRVIS
jgi:hypothetical protein